VVVSRDAANNHQKGKFLGGLAALQTSHAVAHIWLSQPFSIFVYDFSAHGAVNCTQMIRRTMLPQAIGAETIHKVCKEHQAKNKIVSIFARSACWRQNRVKNIDSLNGT
jgi:hypothetical protein